MNQRFKARLLFFAMAILALIGGVSAFVNNRGGVLYCSTTYTISCTLTKQNFTITTTVPGIRSICTDIYEDPCTTKPLITAIN
jgi:hypothetical protein